MAFSVVPTPVSGTAPRRPPESAALSETDLALVEALQVAPRAPWTRIAAAVGIDATTAARRWNWLVRGGLAWMTAYAAPPGMPVAYIDVACRPDRLHDVGARLSATPHVFSIERTAGPYQLLLYVIARDLTDLDAFVTDCLGRTDGVRDGVSAVRVSLRSRTYREGSGWLVHALDSEQRRRLAPRDEHPAPRHVPRHVPPLGEADARLLRALGGDGRRPCAELARECALSETTVRRRLARLQRHPDVHFRCDVAQRAAGWPVIATYRLSVPADELAATGAALAALRETRLCVAVTGTANLLLSTWVRSTAECHALETRIRRRFPHLRVTERELTLHTLKRMGRLLDPQGRAIGHVPPGVARVAR
ncbi:Lrp/AsnC family transcriptional regulator [Streptomyces niger]|uniref:Lrp/AsnC family transcriptional regulator n=1 Tax=Streptomyces niger TaxID=66373 RepID=UPI00069A8904|nr:Lrp/AsnC family transcriptional regulator [Streptomyces niger]